MALALFLSAAFVRIVKKKTETFRYLKGERFCKSMNHQTPSDQYHIQITVLMGNNEFTLQRIEEATNQTHFSEQNYIQITVRMGDYVFTIQRIEEATNQTHPSDQYHIQITMRFGNYEFTLQVRPVA